MRENENILSLLREKGAEAAREALRGVILQPGATGDCILTLPLAEFMKECLELGGIDIFGHTEYISILPGRTCVDGVRSIDSIDLHRLFVEADTFELADRDALIDAFSDYAWIITFLGEPGSNFEQNLIFTINCSRSAEIITLSMKPLIYDAGKKFSEHISDFYIQQFISQSGLSLGPRQVCKTKSLIKATKADINRGKKQLEEIGIELSENLVVIQPGSGSPHKCYHLNNFLAVAEELASKDIKVIFLLGPAESERFDDATTKKITGAAKCLTDLSLTEVLGLLSCADSFAGNDSGITHLAAALGVKTIALFGPTEPRVYSPIGPDVKILTSSDVDFAKKPSASLQKELLEALTA